jgi:hypothetical protein
MLTITTQAVNFGKTYSAWITTDSSLRGSGSSKAEAIGNLILQNGGSFDVAVTEASEVAESKTTEGIILVRKNPIGGYHACAEEDSTMWAVNGTEKGAIDALVNKHSHLKGREVQVVPS